MFKYSKYEKMILTLHRLISFRLSSKKVGYGNIFHLKKPDFSLSPITSMHRADWKNAAKYLLSGAFKYIRSENDLMVFPKQPGKSYPHRIWRKNSVVYLEGLCRTLFLAAPLLKEEPTLRLNRIGVASYYRKQLQQLVTSGSKLYVVHRKPEDDPNQQLVELGTLAISLSIIPELLWEPLDKKTKNDLKDVMLSYAEGPTVPNNWRFFNIFILSFFKSQGYKVNEALLKKYLHEALSDYRGQGWYHDNPAYDYYSMWGFQTYGAIWIFTYGDFYPEIADSFKRHFRELYQIYPYMFGRNGKMIMWGRSITYRMAAIAPFPFTGIFDNSINHGWMRRIASGVLLQFLQHPEFLKDGVPTLGFYDAFEPGIQGYSCRGSVYWIGKAFLGLMLPKDIPFWTETENEGPWLTYDKHKCYHYFSEGSKILVTNYSDTVFTEIRSSVDHSNNKSNNPYLMDENYNRLSYNSEFPWQADNITNGTVAMNYVFMNEQHKWECVKKQAFQKFDEGIYYREAAFDSNPAVKIFLAEKPLYNGILRMDEVQTNKEITLRLGHYALPELSEKIKVSKRKVRNCSATIIDNGQYQLALIALAGWRETEVRREKGLHPESKWSAVINVSAELKPIDGERHVLKTLMLWKKSGEDWMENELFSLEDKKMLNLSE